MTRAKESPDDRKKRLAKVLKANIAKRKAQAKQRQQPEPDGQEPPQKV